MPGSKEINKVVLLGAPKSGKSSLILRVSKNIFFPEHVKTAGKNFSNKTYNLPDFDQQECSLQLWDIGEEILLSSDLLTNTLNSAAAVIVVVDLTNEQSCSASAATIRSAYAKLNPGTPIIIVGTKSASSRKIITKDEIQKLAEHALDRIAPAGKNKLEYFLVDAETGEGCDAPFERIAQLIMQNNAKKTADLASPAMSAEKTGQDINAEDNSIGIAVLALASIVIVCVSIMIAIFAPAVFLTVAPPFLLACLLASAVTASMKLYDHLKKEGDEESMPQQKNKSSPEETADPNQSFFQRFLPKVFNHGFTMSATKVSTGTQPAAPILPKHAEENKSPNDQVRPTSF